MNYKKHYNLLISRAQQRTLYGYIERHHVLPRCLGGGDESTNLVKLTPEEHYVAHQLLVKIHPGNRGLLWAALRLSCHASNHRAYGWLRRQFSSLPMSPEHRAHLSVAALGNKSTKGLRHPKEWQSAARGVPKSEKHRKNIGNALKGKRHSNNARKKMSEWQQGRKLSEEHRANISRGLFVRWKKYREQKVTAGIEQGAQEGEFVVAPAHF